MSKILLSKNFWLIAMSVTIIIIIFYWYNQNKKYREERDRHQNNIHALSEDLQKTQLANGAIMYSKNTLEVKYNELSLLNSNLGAEIEAMGIKLKNAEAATKVEIRYVYIPTPDKINVFKISDSTFKVTFIDSSWINMEELIKVTMYENDIDLCIDTLNITLNDELTIVNENIYKGWWFWKKVVSSKIHVKSNNPYTGIDRIYTIKFKNNHNK